MSFGSTSSSWAVCFSALVTAFLIASSTLLSPTMTSPAWPGPMKSPSSLASDRDIPLASCPLTPLATAARSLTAVAARLDRWLGKHLAELERATPSMPLEDRAADTWEPLVAVADLAGGPWPGRARDAAVALAADQDSEARTSDGIRLLADIRSAFAALGNPDAAITKDLLRVLNADSEAPWAAIGMGGLTSKRLGDMLSDFEIRPGPRGHPVRGRPGPGLHPRGIHRRLAALLPARPAAGIRAIRAKCVFPGQP